MSIIQDLTPKETLLVQLDWVKNSYLLGFTASFLLSFAEFSNITKGIKRIELNNDDGALIEAVDLDNMRKRLNDDEKRKSELHSFLMFQMKVSASEPFELIKDYCKNTCACKGTCEETCNMAKWKKLEFYHFGRILRNCLSHNSNLEFNKDDIKKEIFPVSWGDKTITEDMDGKPLEKSVFKYNDVPSLIDAYRTFVEAELE